MTNKDPRYGMCKEEKWVAIGISLLVFVTVGILLYLSQT